MTKPLRKEDHTHAWQGSWSRPMRIDEKSLDPLTVARMTDHNVRGVGNGDSDANVAAGGTQPPLISDSEGHYDIDGASLAVRQKIVTVIASDADH